MKYLPRVLSALPLFLAIACGGKAVVDEPLGAGGSGTTSSVTSTGSGVLCTTPEPVGALNSCGTSAVTTGGGNSCISTLCDSDGNRWESDCEGNTCVCSFNDKTRCTCFIEGATLCTGTVPSCCPAPFPG
jgi:hypothetical protein